MNLPVTRERSLPFPPPLPTTSSPAARLLGQNRPFRSLFATIVLHSLQKKSAPLLIVNHPVEAGFPQSGFMDLDKVLLTFPSSIDPSVLSPEESFPRHPAPHPSLWTPFFPPTPLIFLAFYTWTDDLCQDVLVWSLYGPLPSLSFFTYADAHFYCHISNQ